MIRSDIRPPPRPPHTARSPEHAPRGHTLLFARTALRHPRMLGAVAPSSRALVARLLAPIPFADARWFVEYGPGLGAVTSELLRRARPDAHLVAFETNAVFAADLRARFRDARLRVVHASAEEAPRVLTELGRPAADCVVSSLPLTLMSAGARRRVLDGTRAVLGPGATFGLYQYTRAVLPDLRATFGTVRQGFEVRNLPPAWVFWCSA